MKCKDFLTYALATLSVVALTGTPAQAQFGLDKVLGGGGGGGDWKSIAKNFDGGLVEFGKQAAAVGGVIADLADALGLKQEAALMRKNATDLEEKGDTIGTSDLDAYTENSDSTLRLIEEKLEGAEELSAEQKKKMTKAAARYAPALLGGVKAGAQLAAAASDASSAGTPGFTDGVEVLKVAKNIPTLVPNAIGFMTRSVEAGQKLFSIMREKGVAVPDLDIDMSEMDV